MPRSLLAVVTWCVLVAGSAVTSTTAAPDADADAGGVVLLTAAVACAFAVGRLLPCWSLDAYALGAAVVICVLVVTAPGGLSGEALAPPLGYGNANGALCAQAAVVALIPLLLRRSALVRTASLLISAAALALSSQTGSLAGVTTAAVSMVVLLGLAVLPLSASGRTSATRGIVLLAGVFTTAAIVLTAVAGAAYDAGASRQGAVERLVDTSLTERRVVLWAESLDLLADHPWTGVGAGRFAEESATARQDSDARWAHSAFLQYAAEAGVLGLVSLLGLCAAMFVLLWRCAGADGLAAVGACAAASILVHAAVDYVLHFPVLVVLPVVTVSVCLGSRRPARSRASASQDP